MIIALPVEEKSMDAAICQSFGRTPYYLFYDTETGTSEFRDNTAPATMGGAGIRAAQLIVDGEAEALLAPRCGENAAQVLRASAIKIYRTEGDSIPENIEAFKAGRLNELEEIHPGYHNHQG